MTRFTFAQEQDIRRIAKTVLAVERQIRNRSGDRGVRKTPQIAEVYIAYTDQGTVPARVGTTAGSQTVTLCEFNSSNVISTTDVTVTALNIAGATVSSNTYVMVKRDPFSGSYVVDFEDCG